MIVFGKVFEKPEKIKVVRFLKSLLYMLLSFRAFKNYQI